MASGGIGRLRKSDGQLASLLASSALARLVTHFVLHPAAALHFQALRRATGLSTRSLQHETARLEKLGLVRREADGRRMRYRTVVGDLRWRTLRNLVREFAEPAEVLRVALAGVRGIDAAFIYGSYARKVELHAGSDVDVLVVGDTLDDEATRLALAELTLEVSGLLGREVNVSRYTRDRLAAHYARGGPFIRAVLAGDKEWLIGSAALLRLPPPVPATRPAARGSPEPVGAV
jgi:predicted nucleotidyltransferase